MRPKRIQTLTSPVQPLSCQTAQLQPSGNKVSQARAQFFDFFSIPIRHVQDTSVFSSQVIFDGFAALSQGTKHSVAKSAIALATSVNRDQRRQVAEQLFAYVSTQGCHFGQQRNWHYVVYGVRRHATISARHNDIFDGRTTPISSSLDAHDRQPSGISDCRSAAHVASAETQDGNNRTSVNQICVAVLLPPESSRCYASVMNTIRFVLWSGQSLSVRPTDWRSEPWMASPDAFDAPNERRCDCGHPIADHEDGALCHFCSCTVPLFSVPEIAISRDSCLHRWVILNGSHPTPTKFLDTATSKNVINYIVGRALGPVRVMVL